MERIFAPVDTDNAFFSCLRLRVGDGCRCCPRWRPTAPAGRKFKAFRLSVEKRPCSFEQAHFHEARGNNHASQGQHRAAADGRHRTACGRTMAAVCRGGSVTVAAWDSQLASAPREGAAGYETCRAGMLRHFRTSLCLAETASGRSPGSTSSLAPASLRTQSDVFPSWRRSSIFGFRRVQWLVLVQSRDFIRNTV